jgi:hypothetical protein
MALWVSCAGAPSCSARALICTLAMRSANLLGAAIGSGGAYALAAARALIDIPGYDAKAIGARQHPRAC